MSARRLSGSRRPQRGAATLVVVMALFLVMALLAAYANRSMLFEQRMASSYLRASLSQEAAEGGIEWTLAQLNGGAINGACQPVSSGGQRFADRYLQINAADRTVVPAESSANGNIDCAHDPLHQGWACRCAAPGPTRTAPPATDTGALPPSSFVVSMGSGGRPGAITLKILGCTDSIVDNCLGSGGASVGLAQLARTRTTTLIDFVPAVRNPPASPLVVKGDISSSGSDLGLHNTDPRSNGMLATYGGTWPPADQASARLQSVPGTATNQVVAQDGALNAPDVNVDKVFRMYLGANVDAYKNQPAARLLTCSSECGADIQTAYNAGQRIFFVNGNVTIGSNLVIGTTDSPVVVVANGNITLTGAFQFNGMLVAKGNLDWSNNSGSTSLVNGMVLVGGNMQTTGSMDIAYQQGVADQLRNRIGSFVRVPGGWIDTE